MMVFRIQQDAESPAATMPTVIMLSDKVAVMCHPGGPGHGALVYREHETDGWTRLRQLRIEDAFPSIDAAVAAFSQTTATKSDFVHHVPERQAAIDARQQVQS